MCVTFWFNVLSRDAVIISSLLGSVVNQSVCMLSLIYFMI